jgi:hypothetical protein
MTRIATFALVSGLCVLAEGYVYAQQAPMNFFVTSVGLGKGGDLGGLASVEQHRRAASYVDRIPRGESNEVIE